MSLWIMPYHHQFFEKSKYVFWNGGKEEIYVMNDLM